MDTNDVVTLAEAKAQIEVGADNADRDAQLANAITAVSRLLDDQCGPIVQRVETNTVWVTHPTTVRLEGPLAAVGSVTPYSGGVAQAALAESDTTGYRLTPRTRGTGTYTGALIRTGGRWTAKVVVNATHGRYATTATVDARFKRACFDIIRNLWRANEISVGEVGGFDVPFPTFPAAYAIPNQVRDLLGEDWNGNRNTAHVGVMFG